MKRCDIKYRGLTRNNEWVYGDLLQMTSRNNDSGDIIRTTAITVSDLKPGIAMEIYDNEINIVKSFTVGQFTGVYDNSGKEIYEGDIVDIYNSEGVHYSGVVVWDYGFMLAVTDKSGNNYIAPLSLNDNHLYVIKGNIHETKDELVKSL